MFPANSISLKTSLGTTTTTTSTAMMLWWGDGGLFAHNLTTLNNSVETVARCVCRGWGSGVGGCGSGCVWRCFGDVDDIYHHHNCCCAAYDWDWGGGDEGPHCVPTKCAWKRFDMQDVCAGGWPRVKVWRAWHASPPLPQRCCVDGKGLLPKWRLKRFIPILSEGFCIKMCLSCPTKKNKRTYTTSTSAKNRRPKCMFILMSPHRINDIIAFT